MEAADFPSDAWLDRAARLVDERRDALAALAPDRPLGITVVVDDGPAGALVYSLVTGPGVQLRRGPAAPEHLRLTTDRATAGGIASGTCAVSDAFLDGAIRVTGDVERLLDARDLLVALDAALAPARRASSNPPGSRDGRRPTGSDGRSPEVAGGA